MPESRSVNIDSPIDLISAKYYLKKNKRKFSKSNKLKTY